MCGIAGLVGPGAGQHVDRVRSMVAALRHRGPDEDGISVFDHAVLGNARLSVVAPDRGHQPILGPSGRTAMVCNGEIYGFGRIKERFSTYPFRTGSDVEVIHPLYERYGEDFLPHLPGTFSLALWDDRKATLHLARDRFGERPLYYALTSEGLLVFASESHALRASGLVDTAPDAEVVAHMLRQGYVPSGKSVWSGIQSLGHASALKFRPGATPEVHRWWKAPEVDSSVSESDAVEWFREELDRSVRDQLEADVPVGAFLSGGVDSTTVAALASRHRPGLHAFVFDMPGESEVEFASETAERHGLTLHVCRPDVADLADQIVGLATIWDEPFGDSSALPTSMLARFARDHVKVVLTGDGADELLGGYLVWARSCLHSATSRQSSSGTAAISPAKGWRSLAGLFRGRRIESAAPTEVGANRGGGSEVAFNYASFRQYFSPEELAGFGLPALGPADIDLSSYGYGTADDIIRFDLDHYLPGDILVKTDRASMACGLEVRAPFLDVKVAEGCLTLPPEHKVDDQREKLLLRRAFGALWPDSVKDRRKQGFGAPMASWLKVSGVDELKRAHLLDASSPLADLVDMNEVSRFVTSDDQRTWNLLMLSIWWGQHRRPAELPQRLHAYES